LAAGLIVTVQQDRLKPINEWFILLEVISTRYYFAASIESTVQHIQLTTSAYWADVDCKQYSSVTIVDLCIPKLIAHSLRCVLGIYDIHAFPSDVAKPVLNLY
jgi:hypothetical protein